MERVVGTVVRGLRCPIINEGDKIDEIATSTLLRAAEVEGFEIEDRDILTITESVVARAQGNYATIDNIAKDVKEKFPFMMYAPVIFVSAKTNQRMNKILETVEYVASEHAKRVSTSALNDVIGEAVMLNQPPSDKGKRLKIYYGSQTGVKPPKFTLFINDKNLTHFSYQRYLENKIRENFGFEGTPVQFEYREKNKK